MARDLHFPGRSTVIARNGMCATSHPLAAHCAIRILEDGGNAVDAAIGAAVLLGICEPQMTGIGGDCFVLVKPAGEDRIVALNGSGRAPAALRADAMRDRGLSAFPEFEPDAVTVPGAVDAFCRLSADWGKLGLAASLAPAIRYAEEGVPVAARVAQDWTRSRDVLRGDAERFYLSGGKALREGQVFAHPAQADVLRRIADDGRAAFYEGEVAEDMVSSLNALGSCHTLEDFAATACDYAEPVSGSYRGVELVEHPPNGQGATAILLANILSHFDLASLDPFGSARAHLEAEASKLAYDARDRFIADADCTTRLDHMLDLQTAERLAALIDPKRARKDLPKAAQNVHKDTIYLTVVDRDRMAVSLIYSIFHGFGSGIASGKFGVLFQNRGSGFNLENGHPNEAAGGKRPMHTIIPGMLRQDGRVTMPFGVMGGAYQPCGHVRFLSNMTDFGMDAQTAIDGARCFADGPVLEVERGYSEAVCSELADLGHEISLREVPLGGAQAIGIDNETGTLHGASDSRKDGAAIGY